MYVIAGVFICLGGFCLFALPIVWLAAEIRGRLWLRLVLGITTVVAFVVVAHNLGDLGGEWRTNDWFAKTNTKLIDATVSQLDQGNTEAVLASLKNLQKQYHPNYEYRSHFDELVDEAVKNMQSANVTAPK